MGLESNRPATGQVRIQLFISHSSEDHQLADKVVKRLQAEVDISDKEIRCTSVKGCKLSLGDPVPDVLRRDLEACSVVIGLLTHGSVDSRYVLMELGAAWMAQGPGPTGHRKKTVCLLLAPGLSRQDLPGPFRSIHVMQLSDPDVITELIATVIASTGARPKEHQPEASRAQAEFVRAVKRLPRWRRRLWRAVPYGVLAALAAGIFGGVWLPSPPRYPIHLFTGTKGGQFHQFGTWLARKMKSDEHAAPTLVETGGSVDNCERIEHSEANTVALAWTSRQCGDSKTDTEKQARVVAALFPEVLHVLVYETTDSADGSVPDLRGKKVYLGNDKSGTRSSAMRLLSQSRKGGEPQYTDDEIEALIEDNHSYNKLTFMEAAKLLQKGKLDAAFIGTGLKAPAVITALETGSVRLVSLPPDLIARMRADHPDEHYEYAALEKDAPLKAAYEPNAYGLTSSGHLAWNELARKASLFKFNSFASDVVLLATEAVDKEFVEQLLNTLYKSNRHDLVEELGVSETYLEQRSLLNQRIVAKGMLLNTSVEDFESFGLPLRWRRRLRFLAGMLGVFLIVTVVGALLSVQSIFNRREGA